MIRYFPTHNNSLEYVDDKGGIDPACFGLDIGKVSHPQLVWAICSKVAFDQIIGTLLSWSLFGGDFALASPYALNT